MFIRQLEYLVALSQLQHFGRAAKHCNVSQPGLSNAIKQLEEEIGVPVVQRHKRFQGFTVEGMHVVEWAKRLVADRNAMLDELSILKKNLTGRLRLGAMPTISPILPFITMRFAERHPGIGIDISFLGIEQLRLKLVDFDCDVGLTYLDATDPSHLASEPLYSQHLGLLVPTDASFATAPSMTWAQAAALPLCLLPRHMYERQVIEEAFRIAGVQPTPRLESDSIVNLAFHVMHGGLATIIPAHFTHVIGAFPGTRMINLVEPVVRRDVGLVWVEGEPMLPMALALRTLLSEMSKAGDLAAILEKATPPAYP